MSLYNLCKLILHSKLRYPIYNFNRIPIVFHSNTIKCMSLATNTTKVQNDIDFFAFVDKNYKEQRRIYKNDVVLALNYIQNKPNIHLDQFLMLLKCCGSVNSMPDELPTEKIKLISKIVDLIRNKNITTNIAFYNTILETYIENQLPVEYKEFLSNMTCKPNEETYNLLLRAVSEVGDVNQALEIVNIMKDEGILADERIFSSLVFAHLRTRDIKSAKTILSTMKLAKINLTSLTYTYLLRGYAELSDTHNFQETLKDGRKQLNVKNYISIINSICRTGNLELLTMIKQSIFHIMPSRQFQTLLLDLCIHFIYCGKAEVAYNTYKVLIEPEVGFLTESNTYASELLNEMVKSKIDTKAIIHIIDDLISTKRNEYALYNAIHCSLTTLNIPLAMDLLKYLHSKNIKIRNHYFWPILIHTAKNEEQEELFNIFQTMRSLDMKIEAETLENYSLNHIKNIDVEIMIQSLKDVGIKVSDVITPLAVVLLRRNRITDVGNICSKYNVKLKGASIIKPLTNAYVNTNNLNGTITIIKHLNDSKSSQSELAGQLMVYLFNKTLRNGKFAQLINLLENCKKNDVYISAYHLDKLEYLTKHVDNKTKSKITILLSQLLDVKHNFENGNVHNIPHPRNMNLQELECHLIELRNKKMELRGVLRKLIQMHCRNGNLQRVQELLEEFNKSNYKISVGMKAGLLDLYIKNNKLQLANNTYNEIRNFESNFNIDEFKVIDLANLFVDEDKFEEAVDLLEDDLKTRTVIGGKTVERNCWRLLSTCAQKKDYGKTKTLFNILTESKLCEINNIILGPLVRVHLNNNDLHEAVKTYTECCMTYKTTPLQHELLCKLVDNESPTDLLKQVIEVTDKVHGINSAKLAIAACLAETGKSNTLQEFLSEQKADLPVQLLAQHCNRWVNDKNIEPLQMFLKCKQYLSLETRNLIIYDLVRIHYANDDLKSTLKLCEEIQQSDYPLSQNTKKLINSLLKTHNVPQSKYL